MTAVTPWRAAARRVAPGRVAPWALGLLGRPVKPGDGSLRVRLFPTTSSPGSTGRPSSHRSWRRAQTAPLGPHRSTPSLVDCGADIGPERLDLLVLEDAVPGRHV